LQNPLARVRKGPIILLFERLCRRWLPPRRTEMDLPTNYMGLHLPHPLIVGASPLVGDLDTVRRLEDAGAAAIVMSSLFEEQLVMEQMSSIALASPDEATYAGVVSYFEGMDRFKLDPDGYLEQLQRIKEAVIASLNGIRRGGWLNFAKLMHQAGADALELNVYLVATDVDESGAAIEQQTIDMLRAVKDQLDIPVAVKLSPFYTALAHFARDLDAAGADGLVLFNRFCQPDIDVESMEIRHRLELSTPHELLVRLRWLAILHGRVECSLAATGGVHGPLDVVKAVMTGASAVQIVSAILRDGPSRLTTLRKELAEWLEEHEFESIQQILGSMSLERCPDPRSYERANYMEILQSWE
jgi:dihydroorotate dehydrogenase (fumarate)